MNGDTKSSHSKVICRRAANDSSSFILSRNGAQDISAIIITLRHLGACGFRRWSIASLECEPERSADKMNKSHSQVPKRWRMVGSWKESTWPVSDTWIMTVAQHRGVSSAIERRRRHVELTANNPVRYTRTSETWSYSERGHIRSGHGAPISRIDEIISSGSWVIGWTALWRRACLTWTLERKASTSFAALFASSV